MLPVFYLLYGLLIGLIPGLIIYLFLPKGLFSALMKVKLNPGKYILVLVKPYNRFVAGKRFQDGIMITLDNITYTFLPRKIELLDKLPFLEVYLTEAFVMDSETRKELSKLLAKLPGEKVTEVLEKLIEIKDLKGMLSLLEPEEQEKALARIRELEEELTYLLEDNSILDLYDKVKKEHYVLPIDWDKLKDYFLAISPTTTYYYAEDLARALIKRLKVDNWFWIVAILAIIIGGVIAYKMLSG